MLLILNELQSGSAASLTVLLILLHSAFFVALVCMLFAPYLRRVGLCQSDDRSKPAANACSALCRAVLDRFDTRLPAERRTMAGRTVVADRSVSSSGSVVGNGAGSAAAAAADGDAAGFEAAAGDAKCQPGRQPLLSDHDRGRGSERSRSKEPDASAGEHDDRAFVMLERTDDTLI